MEKRVGHLQSLFELSTQLTGEGMAKWEYEQEGSLEGKELGSGSK